MRFYTTLAVAYALLALFCYVASIVATSCGDAMCIAYGVVFDIQAVGSVVFAVDAWKKRRRS